MAKVIFVLGGARSGKSGFAEGIAKKYQEVVYIATAEAGDEEMRKRINAHRERRPAHWETIESPYNINEAVAGLNGKANIVIIDCITLYITNLLLKYGDVDESAKDRGEAKILNEIETLCRICKEVSPDIIIVSNETGLGIVPENVLSRLFLDVAGRTNQLIANHADEVYFMVAGIAQRIK